ncbi:hypothetical protein H4P12_06715 [Paracoccus sp. 11-3]|uniref:Flagellar protein FliL n=2 Tax=Paracoccus amoyensis TaxID=2760093 RepID=A0A926GFI4_9RHOB|nr:hypothetical protein [Paracoccus amoyensis]
MKKLLTLAIPLVALIGGVTAGDMLKPQPKTETPVGEAPQTAAEGPGPEEKKGKTAWFTFPNQFFIPIMRNGDMGAVMIMTLSIETEKAHLDAMQQQEHRLRDALLRQLMIRANSGGFDGNFTSEASLGTLRKDLLAAVDEVSDLPITAILIEDIARQQG